MNIPYADTARGLAKRDRRIAALEAVLREIEGTYESTPQTPTKLCAALHAVSKLAAHALRKPTV